MDTQVEIAKVTTSMKELLQEKNKRYGNSALEPCTVFNSIIQNPEEDVAVKGILIRIGDKLKRIENSKDLRKNDVADLIGYLNLLCIKKGWTDFSDLLD